MTAAILDFCAARRGVLVRELVFEKSRRRDLLSFISHREVASLPINDFAGELINRFEFIANASAAELDAYEATLSPETRAIFGLAVNDGSADTTPD